MSAPIPDEVAVSMAVRSVTDRWDEPLDEVHDVPQIVNAILASEWLHDRFERANRLETERDEALTDEHTHTDDCVSIDQHDRLVRERDEALAEVEQVEFKLGTALVNSQLEVLKARDATNAAHAAGVAEGVARVKVAVEGLIEASLTNASYYELTEAPIDADDLIAALAAVEGDAS